MSNTDMGDILARLEALMAERRSADPETSYVARLYSRGREKIAQKLGEEAVETVIAATKDSRPEMISESADMLFHWLVLLGHAGISLDEIAAELARREGTSGMDEKKSRKEG